MFFFFNLWFVILVVFIGFYSPQKISVNENSFSFYFAKSTQTRWVIGFLPLHWPVGDMYCKTILALVVIDVIQGCEIAYLAEGATVPL